MLRLHIRSSQINRIEDLNEYGVQIRGDFVIDLSELLIEGVIDTYMIDVIYGFKSRLDRPLELSVVPNTIFEWQDSDLFNPLHPAVEHIQPQCHSACSSSNSHSTTQFRIYPHSMASSC
jgi:hypothetical protein